jgi:hypothetical protein
VATRPTSSSNGTEEPGNQVLSQHLSGQMCEHSHASALFSFNLLDSLEHSAAFFK